MLKHLRVEGHKAGVEIKEVVGEPAIPPELLIARILEQLADQLARPFERETAAQQKRSETPKAKSTADEQPRLVAAQIAAQVANQHEVERALSDGPSANSWRNWRAGSEPKPSSLDRIAWRCCKPWTRR